MISVGPEGAFESIGTVILRRAEPALRRGTRPAADAVAAWRVLYILLFYAARAKERAGRWEFRSEDVAEDADRLRGTGMLGLGTGKKTRRQRETRGQRQAVREEADAPSVEAGGI